MSDSILTKSMLSEIRRDFLTRMMKCWAIESVRIAVPEGDLACECGGPLVGSNKHV